MSRIPSFESLKARTIGTDPVLFKTAQGAPPMAPDAGAPMGQGMGGVTTGQPDEMQAPESADQERFEQDLSTLAYQFVVDRAPALLPYMLGFEVVDRSDDGSKAVGIYGYKIDDDFYYVPVFFINNQIRGVDLLLNKRTNSFVPLSENWINYIINKHSVTLGKSVDDEVSSTLEQPDLNFLKAPNNHKMASAKEDDAPWSLKTAWHVMKLQSEKLASADPLLKEMFNGVLRSVKGVPLKKSAEAKYINGFMRTVGGPESQISLLKTFRNVKFANAAFTFYENMDAFNEPNVKDAHVHKLVMKKKAEESPKLRIVTAEEMELADLNVDKDVKVEDNTSVDEEEAKQILSHGFTIKDTRPDDSTAEVKDDELSVDYEKRYSSPTEVGKYSFVMSDGKLREGYLLSRTHSPDADGHDATLVYFPEDNVVAKAPLSAIISDSGSESKSESGSYSDLFSSAKPKDEVTPVSGNSNSPDAGGYLFIGPDGQAFGPVKVTSVFKDGDDISFMFQNATYDFCVTTERTSNSIQPGGWDISDRFHNADGYRKKHVYLDSNVDYECSAPCMSSDVIRFCDGINRPTVTSKNIVLPDSWKVLKVTNVNPYTYAGPDATQEERDKLRKRDDDMKQKYSEKYTFGSLSCIVESLHNGGGKRVKIASIGPDEFHIHVDGYSQTPRLTYKEAAITLVSRFGTRPAKAFTILDKAASAGSTTVFITGRKSMQKQAQGVGVSMPMPIPQEASVDPYTGVPVYEDPYINQQHGQFTGVPSLPPEGGLTRGIADGSEIQRNAQGPEDGMVPLDQQAQQLAEEAAAAGQKHVFDQAAIGGLSKVYDTSAVVDSYIPNFMDSLDRLGRVLFLFYWKHDDFTSRYGSDDVVEMEDRLRSVFKQLGDLTLKLKEKAVRTD